jgi:5-methylcytosine-specific restriction endonuclease McrA
MPGRRRKRPTVPQIAALSQAQKGRCGICHMPLCAHDIEVDHIVPVALGGSDARRNLRLVHGVCNRAKGARV